MHLLFIDNFFTIQRSNIPLFRRRIQLQIIQRWIKPEVRCSPSMWKEERKSCARTQINVLCFLTVLLTAVILLWAVVLLCVSVVWNLLSGNFTGRKTDIIHDICTHKCLSAFFLLFNLNPKNMFFWEKQESDMDGWEGCAPPFLKAK